MRLSEFIVENLEPILAEFEEFARTHTGAGAGMDMAALRDHAAAILSAVALDLTRPQTDTEQTAKSMGDAPDTDSELTAAEQHGTDRADSGFSLEEMFAEYRALRASVLRLWSANRGQLDERDLQDLIRFNEAVDQALGESVRRYATSIDRSRQMFMAVLGHDLRTPLSAIVTASEFLQSQATENGGAEERMLTVIHSAGDRMARLVGDLLDFTLSRLGRGIPIECSDTDLGDIARDTVEELRAAHPTRELVLDLNGDLRACWDQDRIRQVLGNVIGNAVQHGAADSPVTLHATGDADSIEIAVNNQGKAIPAEERRHIFDPFKRLTASGSVGTDRRSLGLGLYITREIVVAHGGTVDVTSSSDDGTTFTIRLPRNREQ